MAVVRDMETSLPVKMWRLPELEQQLEVLEVYLPTLGTSKGRSDQRPQVELKTTNPKSRIFQKR